MLVMQRFLWLILLFDLFILGKNTYPVEIYEVIFKTWMIFAYDVYKIVARVPENIHSKWTTE